VPAGSGAQYPTVPLTRQPRQVPQSAFSQQTPSVQLLLLHWFPAVQIAPSGLS
jgi:hypothetical protein